MMKDNLYFLLSAFAWIPFRRLFDTNLAYYVNGFEARVL